MKYRSWFRPVILLSILAGSLPALAADKPNILVFWGDDIGITNISSYSDGIMGYRTPNIDRIANEGIRFTDYYGDQSCTAGRSSFITGQSPLRTGLSKVGLPGSEMGLQDRDITIAEVLKTAGYRTLMTGKWHLGWKDEGSPPARGFGSRRRLRGESARRPVGTKTLCALIPDPLVETPVWRKRVDRRQFRDLGREKRQRRLAPSPE